MIVVIGAVHLHGPVEDGSADGMVGRIAVAAAAAGRPVEVLARIGEDPAGDALVLALARAGVGHVAVLRDGVHRTPHRVEAEDAGDESVGRWLVPPDDPPTLDAADVDLGLRYLPDQRVVVVVHPDPAVLAVASAGATFAGVPLIVIVPADAPAPEGLAADAIVIAADDAPEGVEATGERIGALAAALDRGETPELAHLALVAAEA